LIEMKFYFPQVCNIDMRYTVALISKV